MLYGGVVVTGKPDLANINKLDTLAQPAIREMMRYGIAIDIPYLAELSSRLSREMEDLKEKIVSEIPEQKLNQIISISADDYEADSDSNPDSDWSPINIDSGDQLSWLIFEVLNLGKNKQLKTTKSGNRLSTGKKQLELIKKEHPVIQHVIDYKERAKLKNTYSDKLPQIAKMHKRGRDCVLCGRNHDRDTPRVHTNLLTTRTETGRLASKNPNLQNIPARTKLGRLIRSCFVSESGYKLVSRDFSQIELRLAAHVANEENLIRIFKLGLDPHTDTAMRAFNLPKSVVESDDGKMLYRAPCKNVNFSIFYGQTAAGLYDLMALTFAVAGLDLPAHIDIDWCEKFIQTWFKLYPGALAYMENEKYKARRYGFVWTMFGAVRLIPEMASCLPWIRSAGERQAGNHQIQGSGADLIKLAMAEVNDLYEGWRRVNAFAYPVMSIHDEILSEVEENFAESALDLKGAIMGEILVDKKSDKLLCRVPIASDGKVMDRWSK